MRIGHGFDVHAFEPGDHIMLGGVRIPYHQKFKAHSDGDVLLHALCDALLGAAALGDIGQHFPDNNDDYRGIDSRLLLREVVSLIEKEGYAVDNIDITVIAQEPKLASYLPAMKALIVADITGLVLSAINIKATTHEGIGSLGRCEGIAVHSVVLLSD